MLKFLIYQIGNLGLGNDFYTDLIYQSIGKVYGWNSKEFAEYSDNVKNKSNSELMKKYSSYDYVSSRLASLILVEENIINKMILMEELANTIDLKYCKNIGELFFDKLEGQLKIDAQK
jgi:hypothetical protein